MLDHLGDGTRVSGKQEMEALVMAAIAALTKAEFADELALLQTRLFSRSPEVLFEIRQTATDAWHWSFKPMVELLLHHLRDVASATTRSQEDRRREILWVLEASGF